MKDKVKDIDKKICKFKPGDIFLFKAKGWFSKLYEFFDGNYCHVGVCVSGEINLMIEASFRGVRARDIRTIESEYDVFRVKEEYSYSSDFDRREQSV